MKTTIKLVRFFLFFFATALCVVKCSFKLSDWSIPVKELKNTYDYIIVGSGSAGSRLANKLSGQKRFSVLVLEAGSTPPDSSEIPGFASYTEKSKYDWDYQVVAQENSCLGYVNKSKNFVAGKVIGGGSVMNYMLYQRGNKYDYDNWQNQFGAKGWRYECVFPLFIADEANSDFENFSSKVHGRDGDLCVSSTKFRTPLLPAFINGGKELGYQISDVNDGDSDGFYEMQTTTCDGVIRCSSAKAFIQSIVGKRPNLHISLNSMVTKILFQDNTAVGVNFDRDGKQFTVKAKREIILSAGAFKSPQLLMLSGIGPAAQLKKFNIPVIADLPVGENLQDHVGVLGLFGVGPPMWQMDMKDTAALKEYFHNGTGPLTSPSGCHYGVAYLKTKYATPQVPDVELFGFSSINTYLSLPLTSEYQSDFYSKVNGRGMYLILPIINHPKSVGWVRLNSTNIYDRPLINTNYFAEKIDLDRMVEALKISADLIRSEAFQSINVTLYDHPFPACKEDQFGSDKYFACLARHFTFNIFHAAGTCRMGDEKRKDVVVDHRLRVKGIKKLRVADASIMPQIITGHLNAACIMIGSKAGDMILEDAGHWNQLSRECSK